MSVIRERMSSSEGCRYSYRLMAHLVRCRSSQLLVAILLLSAVLRVAAAIYLGDKIVDLPGTADQISYHTLALRVLHGHGFAFDQPWWPLTAEDAPTAHWSYLYTLYLVAVYAIFGPHPLAARLIQAIIVGLLHPYLVYRIADRIFSPFPYQGEASGGAQSSPIKVVPLLAAGITAVYIYFVYYTATLMTEPFYITAILAALYLTITLADRLSELGRQRTEIRARKLQIALGLTLAVAGLMRQLFLIFIPFLCLWLGISVFERCPRRRLFASVSISLAIVVLAILPFTAYNYSRFGRFVLLNTNAGYAFFWANHPIYGTDFVAILPPKGPSYQELIPSELRHLDEAALDQALLREGLRFVVEDPLRYALLSLSRVKDYFKFWPSPDSGFLSNLARVMSFGVLLPFMLYGLLLSIWHSLFLPRNPQPGACNLQAATLLYLFIAVYTAIHLLSWALIRYRLPVDAVLIIFAAYGLTNLGRRSRLQWQPLPDR